MGSTTTVADANINPLTGKLEDRNDPNRKQRRRTEEGRGRLKLVLFSDLHLDSSFTWMEPSAARRRRQALRDTLLRIVDLAVAERADALLCGGDLYEQDRITPNTAEFLRGAFEGLHPVPVLLAPGNHDWWGGESLYQRVGWSPNVHLFTDARLRPFELAEGFTVWGGAHQAPANTDDFLTRFTVDRSGVNVALFHGSERVWFTQQEQPKQPHAPFDVVEIERARLQHAFLGHFHRPKNAELFTYPGNPDPLSFGEDGQRGAVVATIGPDGTVDRRTQLVAATSVHDLTVDVTGCASQQDVRDLLHARLAGLSGSVRVTLEGELGTEVDLPPADLNALAPQIDGLHVRVGTVHIAYDLEAIARERTVRGQFVRDVLDSGFSADEQRRVLVTGLRALDGRDDLEVP
jgi:exonuclease SbcD